MAVIQSNDSGFHDLIGKNPFVIVKFYASWCGSCKLFAAKYRRISDSSEFQKVVFVDVNAEDNPTARKLAGVNNLPFFATFFNGQLLESTATSREDRVLELLNNLLKK